MIWLSVGLPIQDVMGSRGLTAILCISLCVFTLAHFFFAFAHVNKAKCYIQQTSRRAAGRALGQVRVGGHVTVGGGCGPTAHGGSAPRLGASVSAHPLRAACPRAGFCTCVCVSDSIVRPHLFVFIKNKNSESSHDRTRTLTSYCAMS